HFEAKIRHLDDAHVGLDGAEGIVLRRNAGLGERIEERRLADVRQADDAALQAHFLRPNMPLRRPSFFSGSFAGSLIGACSLSGSFFAGGFSSVWSLFIAP